MSTDTGKDPARVDSVAAADVDPVLWEMSSELVTLRRQLSDLQRTLEARERQLNEVRTGSEVSERALTTLKGVLTDMVLKGRTELHAAREEANRALSARVVAAQAEADTLLADATAALTTVFGHVTPYEVSRATDPALPTAGSPPGPVQTPSAGSPAQTPPASSPPPPPPPARPWPTDAVPPPPPASRLPETPWPVGWVPPKDSSRPPAALRPWPFVDGPLPAPPADPSPPAPPVTDDAVPPWRLDDLLLPPNGGEGFVAQLPSEPIGHAAMNGWASPPASVQTLDPELDLQFERVVGLPPNTEFKTPPRGTPAVPVTQVYDVTSTTVAASHAARAEPPAVRSTDSVFDDLWPQAGATKAAPGDPPVPSAPADGRLRFGLIDALLPIVAVTLVLIVVLSWLG